MSGGGFHNHYSRYLTDTGESHPPTQPRYDGSQPSASGSRSVPPTPGGSFSPHVGYSSVGEAGAVSPCVQQPLTREALEKTIESILKEEIHKYLPNLHPDRPRGTLWFDDDGVLAKAIREIFERDFQEPHANFSQTPLYIIDRWYLSFAQRFHWDFSINGLVRKEFEASLASRMRNQVGRWKQNWLKRGNDAKPQWFKDSVWYGLIRYWEDPKSVTKSEKCSKARLSDPDGDGPHKHTSGRISFKARARMEQEESGDSHPDLVKTLYNTKRNKKGEFVDKKSERIYNEIKDKISTLSQDCGDESSASGGLSTSQKNQIYAEIAPRKKGRLFGTGSLGSRIDQCLSPQGSSQSYSTSDDLREVVDRQAKQIEQTNGALQKANKKISKFNQMMTYMAEKLQDSKLNDMMKNLSDDEAEESGPGNEEENEVEE